MPTIPPKVLEKLYMKGSLRLEEEGFAFELKNLIAPATITEVTCLHVDGIARDDAALAIVPPSGNPRPADRVAGSRPLDFPVGTVVTIRVSGEPLSSGTHHIALCIKLKEIGSLEIPVSDTVQA